MSPDDFQVEELPAYLPSGEGEHLYLWIQKIDVSAERLLQHVARCLGISTGDIGSAGLKDRRAITRQWISVPVRAAELVPRLETDQVTVLACQRHVNKLRTGHLVGNRFQITVRELRTVNGEAASGSGVLIDLEPELIRLARCGYANFFGDQRFGHDGQTLELGRDLLTGAKLPRDIPYPRRKFLLKLSLSAIQSHLFNQVLEARLHDGLTRTVLRGDVLEVTVSGGKFVAEDADAEQTRLETGETALTGPLFGRRMKCPTDVPAKREADSLQEAGLSADAFEKFPDLLPGGRRRILITPSNFSSEAGADSITLKFDLPAGAYATTLIEALFELKSGPDGPAIEEPVQDQG